jgi:hypothetical protein
VFAGLRKVGIIVWEGWFYENYKIYTENITKEKVVEMVAGLPEEVGKQYKIDTDRLYEFLKTKYSPKKESPTKAGGKHRRVSKRKKHRK